MPQLTSISPAAVLPGGEALLTGTDLGPGLSVEISGISTRVELARPTRAIVRIPEGVLPGPVIATRNAQSSNPLPLEVAIPMAENLHPVANPAADAAGNVYTTLSGARGQQTPVSIFRIPPAAPGQTHELRPFTRNLLNPTGLAFGPDGLLYCSSRAEGTVYRIGATGLAQPFAEGLGIATGLAFDPAGDLYVGDRSGTIFKIRMPSDTTQQETFVFATLEPSISAYHLAFNSQGTLYVTGPTTASSQAITAIAPDGTLSTFFRGLGRAQGLLFDEQDNLYVAASLHGDRGIIRITPQRQATLAVSGPNLVGLCLLPNHRAALTTRDALYEVALP